MVDNKRPKLEKEVPNRSGIEHPGLCLPGEGAVPNVSKYDVV